MMRAHMPYLTQDVGRHRAVPALYGRTDAYELTGQRRAVAELPARVRAAIHGADEALERVRKVDTEIAHRAGMRTMAEPR